MDARRWHGRWVGVWGCFPQPDRSPRPRYSPAHPGGHREHACGGGGGGYVLQDLVRAVEASARHRGASPAANRRGGSRVGRDDRVLQQVAVPVLPLEPGAGGAIAQAQRLALVLRVGGCGVAKTAAVEINRRRVRAPCAARRARRACRRAGSRQAQPVAVTRPRLSREKQEANKRRGAGWAGVGGRHASACAAHDAHAVALARRRGVYDAARGRSPPAGARGGLDSPALELPPRQPPLPAYSKQSEASNMDAAAAACAAAASTARARARAMAV